MWRLGPPWHVRSRRRLRRRLRAGWGAERAEARKLFDHYVGLGGNLFDTADTYTDGSSERLLGEFAREERERLVLATKYSTLRRPGDPNSGGGHRKALFGSVEGSLRRLATDYIDLLYLHVWDFRTPVEEVLRGLDDMVRQGKVLCEANRDPGDPVAGSAFRCHMASP